MKNIVLFTVLLFILNSKALSAFRTLEADYITNVFSQSNFVKNPNARVNTQNVTASTGFTVARAITTPLYDTSEFNLSSTQATGNVDWATRSFDAGMKGQNCEARFTYRGFTGGTTKAQIVQGANTVATLDLLASTDPKQVSINFPCGDLTQSTFFRIARSVAVFSGTNEIGGIYVGLATNMANVAQAEFVGGGEWGAATFTRSSSAIQSTFAAFTSGAAGTATGKATAAGSDTTVTFPYLPAGQYKVSSNFYAYAYNVTVSLTDCQFSLQEIDSNTFSGLATSGAYTSTGIYPQAGQLQGNFNFTSGGQRRFRLVSRNQAANGASSTCNAIGDAAVKSGISVYRFPSSSELVVTPERQNVFGGVQVVNSAGSASNTVSSASWTKLTSSSALTRTAYGKAKIETNNDFSITIENMPVGSYMVTASGTLQANSSTAAGLTECIFGLADSATGGAQIGSTSVNATGDTGAPTQYIGGQSFSGVYVNTSVVNRTFFLQAYRGSGTGGCYAYTNTQRPFNITVTPLDQPSNSALYVQGPVLGAQTGAAIPAGYQGETKTASTSSILNLGTALGGFSDLAGLSLSLEPGKWKIIATIGSGYLNWLSGAGSYGFATAAIRDAANNVYVNQMYLYAGDPSSSVNPPLFHVNGTTVQAIVSPTTTTTYKVSGQINSWSGTPVFNGHVIRSDILPATITAIRLN